MKNSTKLSLQLKFLDSLGWLCVRFPKASLWLSRKLGYLISFLFPRESRIAVAQLALAKRMNPNFLGAPEQIYRRTFQHLGESVCELFLFKYLLRRTDSGFAGVEDASIELHRSIHTLTKSAVAISAHLGNFELLAAFHSTSGIRATVIGREPHSSALSVFIDRLRNGHGAESIWRHGRAAASTILRALKQNRSLAVLLDQDTKLESGFAPFFGIHAASPIAPIQLAVRQQLPLFTSFIVRIGPLRHRVISEWIEYNADSPTVVTDILAEYNRRLERTICQYPEQWLWWHRRWRRRPDIDYTSNPEQLRSTEEYIKWLEIQPSQD